MSLALPSALAFTKVEHPGRSADGTPGASGKWPLLHCGVGTHPALRQGEWTGEAQDFSGGSQRIRCFTASSARGGKRRLRCHGDRRDQGWYRAPEGCHERPSPQGAHASPRRSSSARPDARVRAAEQRWNPDLCGAKQQRHRCGARPIAESRLSRRDDGKYAYVTKKGVIYQARRDVWDDAKHVVWGTPGE
jgi:hypothetical protein